MGIRLSKEGQWKLIDAGVAYDGACYNIMSTLDHRIIFVRQSEMTDLFELLMDEMYALENDEELESTIE